jgi:predicted enzyme related to lactoylglutathione lyase
MKKAFFLTVLTFFLTLTISNAQENEITKSGIKSFALLVNDYDETIEFYTKKLGFDLVTDQKYGENMRWVSLKAANSEIQITLGKASEEDSKYVGKQMGENYPIFVMTVKDVQNTYEIYTSKGVNFIDKPTKKPWGIGAVFENLYGNKIYLQTE